MDEDAEVSRLLALPDYAGCVGLGRQALPSSRRFRDCWRRNGRAVDVDMPLARGQRLAEVRADRDARLSAADALTLKTMDSAVRADQDNVKTYKQALRDLPAAAQTDIGAAASPDALAAYEPPWPATPAV
jgi:hypothetical protein